jgi:hypothetical protein
MRPAATGEVRLDEGDAARSGLREAERLAVPSNFFAAELLATEHHAQRVRNLANVE